MRCALPLALLLLAAPLQAQDQMRFFPVKWVTSSAPVYFMALVSIGDGPMDLQRGESVKLSWPGQEIHFQTPPYTPLVGPHESQIHTMYLLHVTPESLRKIARAPTILLRAYLSDGTVRAVVLQDRALRPIRDFVEAHLGRPPERA